MPQIWAGVDIGKEHHQCVVVDECGERLLSRRVFNDEPALLELIADVLALSEDALWAVDITTVALPCSSASCSAMTSQWSILRTRWPDHPERQLCHETSCRALY